ncbi:GNAT family N-acetyltransferase [Haloarcula halophila]|uniref:GNAT family N-acetyltransferase n=1 Tax=Haloarcula TaxID=2237 RepID=UPI0023E46709|nr:GNAT family N-acetyltransferase [Halomicroarcula sp. DFY41]
MQLWRLTRNRYGRAAYEALGRLGVTATSMIEYVATLEGEQDETPRDGNELTVEQVQPDRVASLDAPTTELLGDETVIAALDGNTPVGYLFLSVDTRHNIRPLERTLAFGGGYVRRVFVDPAHRNRGVATAMVETALRRARSAGVDSVTALVAIDNVPSRSLFERHGFEPTHKRRYVRIGPFSHRAVTEV